MATYTVFLLKPAIANVDAALDPDANATVFQLNAQFPLGARLFLGPQRHATPDWVHQLNPFLAHPLNGYAAGISAALVVEHDGYLFALTFGHGRSLLRPNCWVRDFGLRVVLNRVDPAKLRSIDSRIYDDLVVSTRRQTSQSSRVDSFELDIGRALVRGVTGAGADDGIFNRVTGSGPSRFNTDVPLTGLAGILDQLIAAYDDTSYQQHFHWIDNVREVDPGMYPLLDGELANSLQAGNLAGAYLAPSEIVEWERIERFSYTQAQRGIAYPELSLPQYLQILQFRQIVVTPEVLRRHRVRVRYEGEEVFRDEWSVYECLVWETMFNARKFVLFDGIWFEINANYSATVFAFVNSITSNALVLPDVLVGQGEGSYNEGVQATHQDAIAMLDREVFYPQDAASSIEFCDLLTMTGEIVHVKKRTSSATLSHLFSQGSVSAELFVQDALLRASVRERLAQLGRAAHVDLIPTGQPTPADYEIVYAVIAEEGQQGWPPPLQFFSSVNLMHHAKRVRSLGFNVSLQYIRQQL